jgi:hypothetical protein
MQTDMTEIMFESGLEIMTSRRRQEFSRSKPDKLLKTMSPKAFSTAISVPFGPFNTEGVIGHAVGRLLEPPVRRFNRQVGN